MFELNKYYPYNVTSDTLVEVATVETTTKFNKNFKLNPAKTNYSVTNGIKTLFNALSNDAVESINLTTSRNTNDIILSTDINIIGKNGNPLTISFPQNKTTKAIAEFRIEGLESATSNPYLAFVMFSKSTNPTYGTEAFGLLTSVSSKSGNIYYQQYEFIKNPGVTLTVGDQYFCRGTYYFNFTTATANLFTINIVE